MFKTNKQQNQKKITFVLQQKLAWKKIPFLRFVFLNSFILRFIFTTSSIERRRRGTIDHKDRQKKTENSKL
jgi:cell division protein FtsB